MVSLLGVLGVLVIVGVNTAIAALLTRFFRVRLDTQWGPVVFTLFFTPLALLAVTLLLGSFLGFNLGSSGAVVGITLAVPLALGVAFDYFWMPAPEEVELPSRSAGENSPRR